MPSKFTLICAATSAVLAVAVPIANRVAYTAPADIVNTENTVTSLAAAFINNQGSDAREALTTAQFIMLKIGDQVLVPADYVCTPASYRISHLAEAIDALNNTQANLRELLVDILVSTETSKINELYCNANRTFTSLETYTNTVVGHSESPFPLQVAEEYTDIALQALISSLHILVDNTPPSDASQIAFNNTETAITAFATVAGDTTPHSCPADPTIVPAGGSVDAGNYATKLLNEVVPSTYTDVSTGGSGIEGFCEISAYMGAISDYVNCS